MESLAWLRAMRPWRPLPAAWLAALPVAAGGLALVLGALPYLDAGRGAHAMLMPAFAQLAVGRPFGAFGQWLPSAAHAFAFGLFTAALLPRRWCWHACAAWTAIDTAFEAGQHPLVGPPLSQALLDAFGPIWPVTPLVHYLLRGRFDPLDIAAACLGGLAAAVLLHLTRPREETCRAR